MKLDSSSIAPLLVRLRFEGKPLEPVLSLMAEHGLELDERERAALERSPPPPGRQRSSARAGPRRNRGDVPLRRLHALLLAPPRGPRGEPTSTMLPTMMARHHSRKA